MTFGSRLLFPTLLLTIGALAPFTGQAYELKVPWRGDSLPADSYMRTTGHADYDCTGTGVCDLDISAMRWDFATGSYSWHRIDATAPYGRSDAVGWELPLYSPVDGDIIACFRRLPDDNEDGSEPSACPGTLGAQNRCVAGGNHVIIRTADGHLISLNHLRQDSIPAALCPIADTMLFDDDPKFCSLSGWNPALREGARLDNRSIAPIPVRKGEFVGRVGLSGNTNGVHLHMGVAEFTTDPSGNYCARKSPSEFREGWSQVRTPGVAPAPGDWDRLQGSELPIDGTTDFLLWPDPVGERVDRLQVEPGTVPALALTELGGVAAYRNSAGNLAVNAMLFTSTDILLGVGEEEGAVGEVAVSRINNTAGHALVAVRNGSDRLQLIPYYVNALADAVRGVGRTESTPGVGQIEATASPTHDGAVVAFQNSSGALSVINYGVTLTGTEELTVDRRASASHSAAIADVDVATVVMGRGVGESSGAWKGVVTVEQRSADDTVWLRTWQINTAGTSVALVDSQQVKDLASNAAFTAADVDVTVTGNLGSREFAVVSVATPSGLRVQSWQISSAGLLARVDQWDAGAASELSSARAGAQDAALGLRTGAGVMSLISFHVDADGHLGRAGTVDAGAVSSLAVDGRPGAQRLVALARDADGEMTLFHHPTNYSALY
ncbi:hypothetical protein SAMN02745121_08255 [Nannocystis exedens]|uniref:Peptidase family M23 n=1 Tax=Nannocystis exedens TaxID=54 RepID=A0A1I2HWY2_9BACT|nr:hypothetical protein [Nannocystis exedens]PCC72015.1 hypothetical protein NAEX_05094 [Nannocystis exedens]SFF34038.1 hypothetical protein SAMN02745121_08255 [Nannocystis exedens]